METKNPPLIISEEMKAHIKAATSMMEYVMEGRIKLAPIVEIGANIEKIFPCFYHRFGMDSTHYVSLKCKTIEEVTPVLRYITNICGLHQEKEKVQTGLTAKWNFGRLEVEATFSGKCRMVQTGTNTVEVPIMEMRCDDEEVKSDTVNADEIPF